MSGYRQLAGTPAGAVPLAALGVGVDDVADGMTATMASEITAMFTAKFWSAVSLLVVVLTLRTPLAAQQSEQDPPLQCDQTKGMVEYQNDLKNNSRSSLANYCIGELFLRQRNYQSSMNAYSAALKGDGYPSWTKVWSHLQLGKIWDTVRERDRAVMQYRRAIETNDNTRGALDEARKLLQQPYEDPQTR